MNIKQTLKLFIGAFFLFSTILAFSEFNPNQFEWTVKHLCDSHEFNETDESAFSWDTPLPLIAAKHLSTMSDSELDSDWKLNDFFGSIITINLPRSTDRLEEITNELKAINTKSFTIFPAIDGTTDLPSWIVNRFTQNREGYDVRTEAGKAALERLHQGEAGCYMSHYMNIKKVKLAFEKAEKNLKTAMASKNEKFIQEAKKELKKYSTVLILEDDARFGFIDGSGEIYTSGAGRVLREAILDLPSNWDMLYFVIHAAAPTVQTAPHLYKIGKSWSLSAYAVNHSMYGHLASFLSDIYQKDRNVAEVDQMVSFLHKYFNVFAVYPAIAFHKGNTSEISGKVKRPYWQEQPIFTPN